jgi:hypothetical protein
VVGSVNVAGPKLAEAIDSYLVRVFTLQELQAFAAEVTDYSKRAFDDAFMLGSSCSQRNRLTKLSRSNPDTSSKPLTRYAPIEQNGGRRVG